MVYAYRSKNTSDQGRVIEGFGIRRTWQYSSDPKVKVLSKWSPKVVLLEANDITSLKALINKYEKETKGEPAGESPDSSGQPGSGERVLQTKLNAMNLSELKQFAKEKGLPEAEYSAYTRSKLIEYLLLAVNE